MQMVSDLVPTDKKFLNPDTVDNCYVWSKSLSKMRNEMIRDWLLCQLEALDSCHCIIAIGGKTNGSANMLLRFAEGKRKMIVPLIWAGGAAQELFLRGQEI